MSITFDKKSLRFQLHTQNTSYIMEILEGKYLLHAYWGKRIRLADSAALVDLFEAPSFSPNPEKGNKNISWDTLPREYPDYGRSDYESPAIEITAPDGSPLLDPVYDSHRIIRGKPKPEGLPATWSKRDDETETLIIRLTDPVLLLHIDLYYSVCESYDAITRRVVISNESPAPIILHKVLSACTDFYQDDDFELINLYGAWARERQVGRIPIGRSSHVIDSKRGASSHEQNPFVALVRPETDDFTGEVYSMNLVYSGSFMAEVSVNSYGKTRMQMGLHAIDFQWLLDPGASFSSPEAVLVYSCEGLNGMSAIYHRFYRERLCSGQWALKERPILINNWEATYFAFDETKIRGLIDESARLGIELFVLDDGWFGKRDSDTTSLGDWTTNLEKLPGGLRALSDHAHDKGLLFGLWFEPEMVSPDSDLYRAHPDWCLHGQNRSRSEGRNQLILDMGRQEIQDYLFHALSAILKNEGIDYVKWDMNRNMTEACSAALPASRQRETSHRYILGLYQLLERLTGAFPAVLFESCAGGGGRFDPGMLYYMPQVWTSDNTDSYERLKIQWGTSYVYPPVSMGAHVSQVPNHQVHRTTPLHSRGNTAMGGNLGYELDILNISGEEKDEVARQIARYKSLRRTIQFGQFFRLRSPSHDRGSAWMFLSQDREEVVLFYWGHLAIPNDYGCKLPLKYLEPDSLYVTEEGIPHYGSELMYSGLRLPLMTGDFDSALIVLKKIRS